MIQFGCFICDNNADNFFIITHRHMFYSSDGSILYQNKICFCKECSYSIDVTRYEKISREEYIMMEALE